MAGPSVRSMAFNCFSWFVEGSGRAYWSVGDATAHKPGLGDLRLALGHRRGWECDREGVTTNNLTHTLHLNSLQHVLYAKIHIHSLAFMFTSSDKTLWGKCQYCIWYSRWYDVNWYNLCIRLIIAWLQKNHFEFPWFPYILIYCTICVFLDILYV